jgi:3-oxoacyl-[acyl-carrier-protein] synthase III
VLDGYAPEEQARACATGFTHLAIESELFPAAMALCAAREALHQAEIEARELTMIATSAVHRHGHRRLWSLASWLQLELSAPSALPFNIQQGCNGNLIALQLACAQLQQGGSALIVASDRFGTSAFDRVSSDYAVLYGDAATAMVLSETPGRLRLLGIATESLPFAEAMHRAPREQTETAETLPAEHDVRETKRRFLTQHGRDGFVLACREALVQIKRRLRITTEDERALEHIVFPNLSRELLETNYYPAFEDAEAKSLWPFTRTVGHLGTGDAVAGLYHLARSAQLRTGSRVPLVGAGAGFTVSGLLLEVCA